MHYNGPIIRPQCDAFDSVFLEVTVGCTHNQCKFCNFYHGYPFRMAPLEQIEADLKEIKSVYPDCQKIWASGGNPFCMSVNRLKTIAELIKTYLPAAKISTYAHINDFKQKSVADLKQLKASGYVDVVVGIESADDAVLLAMNKGYTVADINASFSKLEAADLSYRIIYLGGLAGKGHLVESAQKTVDVLNDFHPRMMILTTVAILPDTELYQDMKQGLYEDPTELERIQEFRTLVAGLQNEITVFAETSTDFVSFTAHLPKDRIEVLAALDEVIEHFTDFDEARLKAIRSSMTSV